MATTKYTEAGQQRRLDRLKSLREDRKSLSDFAALKDYPEWSKLKSFIQRRIEMSNTEERNNATYHYSEDISSEVFGLRSARVISRKMAFEFVLDCVEKKEDQIKVIDAEIAEVEKTFKSAKEVLA